jgi:phosphoserine phosphatase RsbU/P
LSKTPHLQRRKVKRWNLGARVRFFLVSQGFRLVQIVVILAALSFVLTGSRIAFIDRYGSRADIVASIFVTIATMVLLTTLNRRVTSAINRRFFREAYDAQLILTEMDEAIPTLTKTKQLVELVAEKISDALHPENITIFLDNEGAAGYVAAFSSDASKARPASATQLHNLVLRHDEGIIDHLRKSKSLNFPESSAAALSSQCPGSNNGSVPHDEDSQTLRAVRSSFLIPIASNGRLHGLISLGQRLSELPYKNEDKRLLLVVANQIAQFIENMKLINRMAEQKRTARELEIAAEVQRHLFPEDGLEDDTLEIFGASLPALGVGGDYYDYFEMDDRRTGIAIADVAGKGIAAALLMSTVQASLRCQLIFKERPLTDVVSSMNNLLRRSMGDAGYATFFLAEFDKATHALTYVNAGHNPPMLVRAQPAMQRKGGGQREAADASGPLSNNANGTRASVNASVIEKPVVNLLPTGLPIIGTFLNEPYQQETIQLRSGDTLVAYTDGVTEALNRSGKEFGEERLRSVLVESLRLPARETGQEIISRVLAWQGQASQHDDITLIVVRVK